MVIKKTVFSLIFFLSLSGLATANAARYSLDADHTSITFKIRHLVSKVNGNFRKFSGWFEYDEKNNKAWKTEVTIDALSIDTAHTKRDDHLRTADFFDVKKFPTLSFKSTKVNARSKKSFKLAGDLSIHGVTKPVVFDVLVGGTGTDPWGNEKAGFTATTKINRKDFGLSWNKVLDAGGVLIGDEVEVILEVEGNKTK